MAVSGKKTEALKRKLAEIYDILLKTYGPQKCFLIHETPFQLLVSTILSAQCTDKMVKPCDGASVQEICRAGGFCPRLSRSILRN